MNYFAGFTCEYGFSRLLGAQILTTYIPLAIFIFAVIRYKNRVHKLWWLKMIGLILLSVAWFVLAYATTFLFTTCNIFIPINN